MAWHSSPSQRYGTARAQARAPGASGAAALPEGFCIGCPPPPAGTPAGAPYVKPGYLAAYTCCAVPPAAAQAASAASTAAARVPSCLLLARKDVTLCWQLCGRVRPVHDCLQVHVQGCVQVLAMPRS